MNPQSPAPPPNPAPALSPTAREPQQQPALETGQPLSSAASTPASMPTEKAKKGKLFKTLVAVGIVLAIILIVFLLFILPNLRANEASRKFMTDITAGNISAAASISGDGNSNTVYLQQAAKKASGSYTLKTTKVQDGQHYYLYTLSNSSYKYARTVVKKERGGYKVVSFVVSGTPLSLVP